MAGSSETVEAWVSRIFDHPGEGPEWYRDPTADLDEPEPTSCVRLLTALLHEATRYLAPYSDAQVARGIWYLVDNSCSSYGLSLPESAVDLRARRDCITVIPALFAGVFRERCLPLLSHTDRECANPLNTTCYMWWDIFPSWGTPNRDVDASLLSAMSAILDLDSLACQESALHGLGHWQPSYPERVNEIIDRFLERPAKSEELRHYALSARDGCVQ